MVCILDIGEERFSKVLEVGINVGRDTFNRETIGGDNGVAGVARFVYVRK